MSFTRRSFVIGAGSGFSVLLLAACTQGRPVPTPTPTATATAPASELPAASAFFRSNWAKDPWARGATSFLPVGALPQGRETLTEPVENRIFLAGEAVSEEPGTIRGAVESGRSAARRALDVAAPEERIAVVGAGAAGAEAARVLQSGGVDVIVIEARDRTGGRIDSRVGSDDSYFELGAWRLSQDADAPVIDALADEDVSVDVLAGGSVYATGNIVPLPELPADDAAAVAAAGALGAAVTWAQQQAHDVSLAEAVDGSGVVSGLPATGQDALEADVLLTGALLQAASMTGADADDLGTWFLPTPPDSPTVLPAGPLSAFIDATLDDVDTALSTAVIGIAYGDGGVSLRLATGESLSVDRVIITVPLGVLQQQVIEFDPPLPLSHRSAIDSLSVGNIELVHLEFETAFWDTDATVWVNADADETVRLWINLLPTTGRPTLLGVVTGERALELAELGDDRVLVAARQSLVAFAQPGAWLTQD